MELYKEILVQVPSRQGIRISFDNLNISVAEIVENVQYSYYFRPFRACNHCRQKL